MKIENRTLGGDPVRMRVSEAHLEGPESLASSGSGPYFVPAVSTEPKAWVNERLLALVGAGERMRPTSEHITMT